MNETAPQTPRPAPEAEGAPPEAYVNAIAQAVARELLPQRTGSVHIGRYAAMLAGWDSARYFTEKMTGAVGLNGVRRFYDHALSLRRIQGLALEFGVASGRTITQIANATPGGTVYGFDSFKGLPEDWRTGFGKGAFARTAPPKVPDNVELVIGLFGDTLPGFVASHQAPVSFLHVDCDLYSSTVDILTHLGPHIGPGTVIAFNEYFNYPGWREHEHKAWMEFVAAHGVRYRYAGFTWTDQQVSVVVEENPSFRFSSQLVPFAAG
jgi:hypothetical protein